MNTATDLLTIAAATWYWSFVLTSSEGPFQVFARARKALPLGGLSTCIICLSIWIAVAFRLAPHGWLTDASAVAGVALWVHKYSGWSYSG